MDFMTLRWKCRVGLDEILLNISYLTGYMPCNRNKIPGLGY